MLFASKPTLREMVTISKISKMPSALALSVKGQLQPRDRPKTCLMLVCVLHV